MLSTPVSMYCEKSQPASPVAPAGEARSSAEAIQPISTRAFILMDRIPFRFSRLNCWFQILWLCLLAGSGPPRLRGGPDPRFFRSYRSPAIESTVHAEGEPGGGGVV